MQFDIATYLTRWPNTTPHIIVQPDDGETYLADSEVRGDVIAWKITRKDTKTEGLGKMWIAFIGTEEDVVGLTPKTPISVLEGPDDISGDPTEEETPSWLEQALVAVTRAEEAATRAEQVEKNITENLEEIIEDYLEKNPPAVDEAFSPTITINRVEGGIEIITTNKEGSQTEMLHDGRDGNDGEDGFSPTAVVTQTGEGATITIIDVNGETSATIKSGTDGKNGIDGLSPIASVTQIENGAVIEIEDKNGKTTATVTNGKDGNNGNDGTSCTVQAIEEVEGGHNVVFSWKDANGTAKTETMFVQNGESGVYIGTEEPKEPNINVWIDGSGTKDQLVEIDATLTHEGMAADAKAVGDSLIQLSEENQEQNKELKKTIKGVKTESLNLYNKESVTTGYYIVPATGELKAGANFAVSDYIPVKPGETYSATSVTNSCVYNSDKRNVSYLSSSPFVVPENGAYVRVTTSSSVNAINNYMFVKGDTLPSKYVPYDPNTPYVLSIDNFTDELIEELKMEMGLAEPTAAANIRQHLCDPFIRTQIKLTGDSITAGVGGTGYSDTGELMYGTRHANVLTATCWSNMLYHYIDKRFNRDFVVQPNHENILNRQGVTIGASGYNQATTWCYANIPNPSGGITAATFDFYGDHVGVYYTKSPWSGIFDIYVDNVKKETIDTYAEEESHRNLTKVEGLASGKHTLRIVETGTKNDLSTGKPVKIEGYLIKKEAVVKPWGISGASNHHAWGERENLYSTDDDFVLLQFGTNDRHVSMTEAWTTASLVDIATYIRDTCGAVPILMASCPSNVRFESDDMPEEGVTRYYHMWDVKLAVQKAADIVDAQFVDNYDAFWRYCDQHEVDIDTILADGLHPNDLGYKVMYENIMRALELPIVPDEYDDIVADY